MCRGLPGLNTHPLPRLQLLGQRFRLPFMDCLRVLLPMPENTHSVFLNGLGSLPFNTTLKLGCLRLFGL